MAMDRDATNLEKNLDLASNLRYLDLDLFIRFEFVFGFVVQIWVRVWIWFGFGICTNLTNRFGFGNKYISFSSHKFMIPTSPNPNQIQI